MSLSKIKSVPELVAIAGSGRQIVFTNGCFDLLHVGHVRYLQSARALGEALLVAVNGDASVRALKGPARPINTETDRAEVLAALECVDFVTIFHSDRVTSLVRAIRPPIYVKGGDYTIDTINQDERRMLEADGVKIVLLPVVPGKSTTALLEKIHRL